MPSQLTFLRHDADLFQRRIEGHPALFSAAGNYDDLARQNFTLTVGDLLFRCLDAALGLGSVLTHRLRVPSLALSRTLLESATQLKFLGSVPLPERSALVLRAYSLLKWCQLFTDNADGQAEWRSILARMPADVVKEAQGHVDAKRSWTGLTAKDMLARAGFGPYSVYQYFSAETHGGIVGNHATLVRHSAEKGSLHFGASLSDEDREASANFARRVLIVGFTSAWTSLGGESFTIETEDPELWRKANDRSKTA